MKLQEIEIGSIDAKNELITESADEKARFNETYIIPENINLKPFFDGKKFIVTGLKGTGKTAILRYVALKREVQGESYKFLLFKSDYREEDRKGFSYSRQNVTKQEVEDADRRDYIHLWKWRLIDDILSYSIETGNRLFIESNDWDRLIALKSVIDSARNERKSGSIFPFKIKKGNIEVKVSVLRNYIRFFAEFEPRLDAAEGLTMSFKELVDDAMKCYERLERNDNFKDSFGYYIDELELSKSNNRQFERDIALINDLIVAMCDLNRIAMRRSYKVRIYAAIRKEVATSIENSGSEINKLITDFGVELSWSGKVTDSKSHPLLRILYKRIYVAEKAKNPAFDETYEVLMARYFPSTIGSTPWYDYVLHMTWFRPRDIIRLFRIIIDANPMFDSFTVDAIKRARKPYAEESWVELVEEMRTSYRAEEIKGVQQLLSGFEIPITQHALVELTDRRKKTDKELRELLEARPMSSLLHDLYGYGIVGNYDSGRVRYYFRGDSMFIPEKEILIHNGLHGQFSTTWRSRS
jgi:hypothetical protein